METLSEKRAREAEPEPEPERETRRRVQDGEKEWRCSERQTEPKAAQWVVTTRLDEEDSYSFSVFITTFLHHFLGG